MDNLTTTERRHNAVMGALVADAAALGLHWIYTQPRIRRTAGDQPEFRDPDPAAYEGVPAFFAHGHKHAGDSTMYGEQIAVALRAMVAADGEFVEGTFLSTFQTYFGPGGEYVGYADGPMRETLYNALTMAREIDGHAKALDLPGVSEATRTMIAHYVSRYFLEHDTEGLKRVVREAVGMHDGITKDDLTACDTAVDEMQKHRRFPGPDDSQMPALTRVAIMVARYGDDAQRLRERVEAATRMTNNSDLAVAYAVGLARLLVAVTSDDGVKRLGTPGPETQVDADALAEVVLESFSDLPEERLADLRKAIESRSQDNKVMTLKFGPACDCAMGVPGAIHNLLTADSFTAVARTNIYACGDSCGRAMVCGAVAGALYGVGGKCGIPEEWITRTRLADQVRQNLTAVVDA